MPEWQRSRMCTGGNCVEIAWVSSSLNNGTCVEVAHYKDMVLIRDSKNPDQQPLKFDREEWAAFVRGVLNGDFDA